MWLLGFKPKLLETPVTSAHHLSHMLIRPYTPQTLNQLPRFTPRPFTAWQPATMTPRSSPHGRRGRPT
jgi:hypothetical protein